MNHNSILVPLDGSKLAEQALPVADWLLRDKSQAQLTLLRALETPRLSAWLPAELLPIYDAEKRLAGDYLESMKDQWSDRGYEVRTILAPGPGPVEATVAECCEKRANLVVMTSHGESGWIEAFLGSNTEKIMRLSPAQILVVKGQAEPKDPVFQTIVIPLDGSKRAESAITHALELAAGGKAKIILVGVSVAFEGYAMEGDMRAVVRPDMERIEKYLESQADWLANQGLDVDVVVRQGQAGEEILEVAEEVKSDLILMTSQGRRGLALWHYGSVAERVLRNCKCSVLVVKDTTSESES